MLILDSNVFISYFKVEELHHKEACKIIDWPESILINDYILGEIYTVLLLRSSYNIAVKAIRFITENPKIEIRFMWSDDIIKIVDFINNKNTELSYVDISLLVLSRNTWNKIVSFDKNLAKISW